MAILSFHRVFQARIVLTLLVNMKIQQVLKQVSNILRDSQKNEGAISQVMILNS